MARRLDRVGRVEGVVREWHVHEIPLIYMYPKEKSQKRFIKTFIVVFFVS
jgi:hypothetical protein